MSEKIKRFNPTVGPKWGTIEGEELTNPASDSMICSTEGNYVLYTDYNGLDTTDYELELDSANDRIEELEEELEVSEAEKTELEDRIDELETELENLKDSVKDLLK